MAKIIVRSLEEDVKAREKKPASGLGSRIAARFRKVSLPGELPELRGQRKER